MRGVVELGRVTVTVEDKNVLVDRLRVTVLGSGLTISPSNVGQVTVTSNVSASLIEKGTFTQEFEKANVYVDALIADGNPTSSYVEVDVSAGLQLSSTSPLVVDIDSGVSVRARGTGRGQFIKADWNIDACKSVAGSGLGVVDVKLPAATGAQVLGSTRLAVAGNTASLSPWNIPSSTVLDSFLVFGV